MVPLSAQALPQDPYLYISAILTLLLLITIIAWRQARSRALQRKEDIGDLKRDIENRDKLLDKSRLLYREVLARQGETVLKTAQRDVQEGKFSAAARGINQWIAEEGPHIAPILLERARWSFTRARGELRPYALTGAESYAAAAQLLAPNNSDAEGFVNEIRALRKTEGRGAAPLSQAISRLEAVARDDKASPDLFGTDLEILAAEAEQDADRQYELGRHHLALALIDEAIHIRTQIIGADAIQTLNALSLKGYILLGLSRTDEALPVMRTVAERLAHHSEYGPDHPDTLSCRYQLALVLDNSGRREEALVMLRDIADRQAASPELGINHPDTLESRKTLKSLQEQTA